MSAAAPRSSVPGREHPAPSNLHLGGYLLHLPDALQETLVLVAAGGPRVPVLQHLNRHMPGISNGVFGINVAYASTRTGICLAYGTVFLAYMWHMPPPGQAYAGAPKHIPMPPHGRPWPGEGICHIYAKNRGQTTRGRACLWHMSGIFTRRGGGEPWPWLSAPCHSPAPA